MAGAVGLSAPSAPVAKGNPASGSRPCPALGHLGKQCRTTTTTRRRPGDQQSFQESLTAEEEAEVQAPRLTFHRVPLENHRDRTSGLATPCSVPLPWTRNSQTEEAAPGHRAGLTGSHGTGSPGTHLSHLDPARGRESEPMRAKGMAAGKGTKGLRRETRSQEGGPRGSLNRACAAPEREPCAPARPGRGDRHGPSARPPPRTRLPGSSLSAHLAVSAAPAPAASPLHTLPRAPGKALI